MSWFKQRPVKKPDMPDVLASQVAGHWYYIPTITAIDDTLNLLVVALDDLEMTGSLRDAITADIDRLLEERIVMGGCVPLPESWRHALAS